MAEANDNLWAPWRMQYIRSLDDESGQCGCFLCHYWQHAEADAEHHVVWRGEQALVVMNRFPYTNGHLMIAPSLHEGDPKALAESAWLETNRMIPDAVALLRGVVKAQGFNIGYNLGLCAGAGLPDHLHVHVVPRWSGDTNYMAVLGKTRVIPDALDALYEELVRGAREAGLRS